ncbi:MAG TPA: hypothetical protein VFU42_03570 [Candidatus Deferrimicrobiaceae bacterium]|nr:hypothetical protein [Candidatus Deferrimicrobiaceae bacterium]
MLESGNGGGKESVDLEKDPLILGECRSLVENGVVQNFEAGRIDFEKIFPWFVPDDPVSKHGLLLSANGDKIQSC